MKYNRIILGIVVSLFVSVVYGQSSKQRRADVAFEHFQMLKAAELYAEIVDHENTCYNMKKLAECYRYLGDYKKAEYWYSHLMQHGTACSYDDKDFFYYAMILKRNGNYDKADLLMDIFYTKDPENSVAIEHQDKVDDYYQLLKQDSTRFKVHHTGINSPGADFGVVYFKDRIFFTSARETPHSSKKNTFNDSYYYSLFSTKDSAETNEFELISDLKSPIHYGPISFSHDYKRFYLTKSVYNEKSQQSKIANIELYEGVINDEGEFEIKQELEFGNSECSNGQACLSPDENTLYFVSDRPGGYGGTDIWKTTLNNGVWGPAENLGEEINTEENELFPFIDQEENLFFASEGHVGLGGYDIYVARFAESSKETEYEVSNLGFPINTRFDDLSFVVHKEEKVGYFSSNRDGGEGEEDIYLFEFNEEEKKKEEPDTVEIMYPIEMTIANVYFDYDKSNIKENQKEKLGKLITFLNNNEDARLSMTAHTDKRASNKYNMALSNRRAQSVLNYLIGEGVDKTRIVWTAQGESSPFVECENECSEDDHQMNRRVEFKVLNEKNKILYESKPIL